MPERKNPLPTIAYAGRLIAAGELSTVGKRAGPRGGRRSLRLPR